MKIQKAAFAAMTALALSAGAAQAGTRLFGDSVLNLSDGFSDEITGDGPALVFVAGAQSPEDLRTAVKQLRKTNRVHLIRMTEGTDKAADAAALQAYLGKYRLTAPPLQSSER
jgi:hypothetical protein